ARSRAAGRARATRRPRACPSRPTLTRPSFFAGMGPSRRCPPLPDLRRREPVGPRPDQQVGGGLATIRDSSGERRLVVQLTRAGTLAMLVFGLGSSVSMAGVTTRITVDRNGQQLEEDCRGMLSANGKFFVFTTDAPDLVPDDTNGVSDVFWKDL